MLWSLFQDHRGRVVNKWAHYFPVYERYFQKFVSRPVVIFEIGVAQGGSLQVWKKYFGPYAQVVGIDVQSGSRFSEDQIEVRIGDQSNSRFLKGLVKEFGPPDIVIDDGSHRMDDVMKTFQVLYPLMPKGAIYFVEDMHTCYDERYGGGLLNPNSFIEKAKGLVDELHATWTHGQLRETEFSKNTLSISFHDSCVVFEKGTLLPRTALKFGGSEA